MYQAVGTQLEVINTRAPVAVVLGGAGTGKTTTAAVAATGHLLVADSRREQLRRDLGQAGKPACLPAQARVLFLSFSRTAVAQVLDRATNVASNLLERIDVMTFHGFAWKVISDFGPAFGYAKQSRLLSAPNSKVPGGPAGMTYDDLLPAALGLLGKPAVAAHYNRRYSLVICDEFQDTNDQEWAFLQTVAPQARRILLGDVNQCIYAEMKGIDPEARIAAALSLPGAVQIDLPRASHRDPSGVLPAAADAARERRFNDPAVVQAVQDGRLIVSRVSEESATDEVISIVRAERARSCSVSIFTHTNAATTGLSDALTAAGVRHEQVGLTEAYGEALNAQLGLLRWAIDRTAGGRRDLAVFVAANYRATTPLVTQIMDRSNPGFERALRLVLNDLGAAAEPLDVDRLGEVVVGAYGRLGAHRGQQVWVEAGRRMLSAMRLLLTGGSVEDVVAEVEHAQNAALLGDARLRPRPVQVMNLHQTKGREADATILLLQQDEFHGRERPPYPKLSRLLYVVMTRARQRAYILVPGAVHLLWQPLVDACEAATAQPRAAS